MTSLIEEIYGNIQRQTLWISNEMNKVKNTGLGIQEETITDILLNNIQSEHEENFITKKFSHKDEGNITGSDWLWCIGEPGSWITFAIQAKISDINKGHVNHLLYKDGKQYSKLINFSKRFHFIPKYSIYTKYDEDINLFSRNVPELKDLPPEQWSFTAISPKYINQLTNQKERHYSKVLQFSIPWLYIFSKGKSTDERLASVIAGNLENLYRSFENEFRRQQNKKPRSSYERLDPDNPEPSKMISEFIPLPVLFLMTKKIPSSIAPVANVGVLSNIPVNLALSGELKKIEKSRQWKYFQSTFVRQLENIRSDENNLMIR
jgi:hypothetical protein